MKIPMVNTMCSAELSDSGDWDSNESDEEGDNVYRVLQI